ncbi:DNA-binding transcriptional LysR family regulator [Catenibacillus scindens]|uniref:DNA-binding transcriptional LysR family regulator n=1 Tax=Catenibacillus scindens TaxID=673271 RepID=A0A7W8HDT3_9FIRM|nr:LysR family transcriptional regulator [Catenibacillus scindens]MBB5266118.1 DNA-binding transcriptional LysR family regulator [Catenibacillus scindens]
MNLTQLKTFCSVARTKSFTVSAAELMISQPAVSRQIAGLEEEICARLFIREHNTLALTPAGQHLYEELPSRLEELEALFFSVYLLGTGKRKRLKIGFLKEHILSPQLIAVMREMRNENYYMTIQQYDFNNLEKALDNHDIDAAIAFLWADNAFEGCRRQSLATESLCLAVNHDYAPEIPKIIDLKFLEEFSALRPVMVPKVSAFPQSQRAWVSARIAGLWKGVLEESPDGIVPMVQTGIGSALVAQSHILCREPSVDMIPLEFLSPVQIFAFWKADNKNESVGDFIDRFSKQLE